jgi:hypothetical protein
VTEPLWILQAVKLTSDANKYGRHAWYRLHVSGINAETGEHFSWSVPDVSDPRYAIGEHATIDPSAVPFLGRSDQ